MPSQPDFVIKCVYHPKKYQKDRPKGKPQLFLGTKRVMFVDLGPRMVRVFMRVYDKEILAREIVLKQSLSVGHASDKCSDWLRKQQEIVE